MDKPHCSYKLTVASKQGVIIPMDNPYCSYKLPVAPAGFPELWRPGSPARQSRPSTTRSWLGRSSRCTRSECALTAAIHVDNPCCSYKRLHQVRAAAAADEGQPFDCPHCLQR